jgi:hypothetical protein
MAKKSAAIVNWLQATAVRVTRTHFIYIAAYMASIIVFDSWNVFTHPEIGNRWTLAAVLLVINTVIWYTARIKFSSDSIYILLIIVLVIADIVFAGVNVYWERGLASKAVALFAVPILTSAALRSRSSLLAATTLSVAAYSIATMRYFNLHYGESFRAELYGYVGLYCAVFFVLAGLLLIIIRPRDSF